MILHDSDSHGSQLTAVRVYSCKQCYSK